MSILKVAALDRADLIRVLALEHDRGRGEGLSGLRDEGARRLLARLRDRGLAVVEEARRFAAGAWKRQGPNQTWQRASVSGVWNANEGGQATLVVEPPVAACAMDFFGGQAGPTPVSVRG